MLRWTLALSLFPILICLHLHIAPYSKVEESFNIQAVHDILTFGIPVKDVGSQLKLQYDHMTFPGAVPRTFIGALVLAALSKPVLWMNNVLDRQQLGQCLAPFMSHMNIVPCLFPTLSLLIAPVRVILGLLNAASLIAYAQSVRKALGKTAGLWYIALQASQFHILFYASRTLPNMFAFGISVYCPIKFYLQFYS